MPKKTLKCFHCGLMKPEGCFQPYSKKNSRFCTVPWCHLCAKIMSRADKDRAAKKRWSQTYTDKHKKARKAWRNKNREKDKFNSWKRSLSLFYGITIGDYEKLRNSQGGHCAICGIHESQLTRRLSVDHDHDTGSVRGLLCGTCNSLLGWAKDSVHILSNAITYIEESNQEKGDI